MFRVNVFGLLDRGMVILQLCCWKFSRKRNFVADFIRLKLNFIQKTQQSLFEAPFGGFGGNVCTPSIARCKARSRLPIRHNWTFFAISYGSDIISGNQSKLAFFEGGGSLWAQISDGRGVASPTTVGVKKLEWLPFRGVSKYRQWIVCFCHKAGVWRTDRRTDSIA